MPTSADSPPGPGWVAIAASPGNAFQEMVLDAWGRLEDQSPVIGFRVQPRHCNPRSICHGGMLVTFADFFLPTIARLSHDDDDSFTPTVSLTTQFLAPASLGEWVEGRANVLRRSKNLLFVEGLATCEGTPVMQVSGIFKRGGADGRKAGSALLLERLRAAGKPG